MAILNRFNAKSAKVPKVHGRREKRSTQSHHFWLLNFRRSTQRRTQNALEIFNKVLHKSMKSAHQHFSKNFLREFFKKTTHQIRTFIMATKQQVGLNDNGKASTDQAAKPSIVLVGLSLLHRFICLCVRFILIKVHGEHGPSMPPIDDLLLLESASSIAEKIRTKKVSSQRYWFNQSHIIHFLYNECISDHLHTSYESFHSANQAGQLFVELCSRRTL